MQTPTDRCVILDDFGDHKAGLVFLLARIHDRNHVILNSQRQIDKTSLLKKCSRPLALEALGTTLFREHLHH